MTDISAIGPIKLTCVACMSCYTPMTVAATCVACMSCYTPMTVVVTCVACMSCSQCLSLMAGFCSSPPALSEVTMFFTSESRPVKASHALISLSRPRMS